VGSHLSSKKDPACRYWDVPGLYWTSAGRGHWACRQRWRHPGHPGRVPPLEENQLRSRLTSQWDTHSGGRCERVRQLCVQERTPAVCNYLAGVSCLRRLSCAVGALCWRFSPSLQLSLLTKSGRLWKSTRCSCQVLIHAAGKCSQLPSQNVLYKLQVVRKKRSIGLIWALLMFVRCSYSCLSSVSRQRGPTFCSLPPCGRADRQKKRTTSFTHVDTCSNQVPPNQA
jgi:hypothetical protein